MILGLSIGDFLIVSISLAGVVLAVVVIAFMKLAPHKSSREECEREGQHKWDDPNLPVSLCLRCGAKQINPPSSY